jgi:hypothetical protein
MATSVSKPVEAGTKLSQLDGVDFSMAPVTVALVLQSQCPYCAASMGFYKHLVEFKKDTPFQLAVTSMESDEDHGVVPEGKGSAGRRDIKPETWPDQYTWNANPCPARQARRGG